MGFRSDWFGNLSDNEFCEEFHFLVNNISQMMKIKTLLSDHLIKFGLADFGTS